MSLNLQPSSTAVDLACQAVGRRIPPSQMRAALIAAYAVDFDPTIENPVHIHHYRVVVVGKQDPPGGLPGGWVMQGQCLCGDYTAPKSVSWTHLLSWPAELGGAE